MTRQPSTAAAAPISTAPIACRSPAGVATSSVSAPEVRAVERIASARISWMIDEARCSCAIVACPACQSSPIFLSSGVATSSMKEVSPNRAAERLRTCSSSVASSVAAIASACSTTAFASSERSLVERSSVAWLRSRVVARCCRAAASSSAIRASSSVDSPATCLMLRPAFDRGVSSRRRATSASGVQPTPSRSFASARPRGTAAPTPEARPAITRSARRLRQWGDAASGVLG